MLYAFPQGAMFGKILPKNKVYEHASDPPPEKYAIEKFVFLT
jgi:hypothetical protein